MTTVGSFNNRPKGRASRWRRLGRWLRLQALQMFRDNASPVRTGLGFALGTFIGVFPSFGIGTPVAFLLAGRLGLNRAGAVCGTFLTNPVTAPLYYTVSTWLGLEILGRELEGVPVAGLLNYLRHFGFAFLVGNALFAVVFACAVGLIIFFVATRHQRAKGLTQISLEVVSEPEAGSGGTREGEDCGTAEDPAENRTAARKPAQSEPGPPSGQQWPSQAPGV